MDLVGKIIGNRYEILEKIGVGGMATVYKAKCHVLNRYVAIKVLKDEFTTDEEFIRRFNTEAQSAASLSQSNIVSIYDVANEDNIYYIVMELVKGKTLKQIINEDGALPWKWSVNIAIQIASALETAHKNNIVHRDVKPHNIIITEDGIAKVTDFGIAKAVSNSTITAFGTTIGSVHYFSPEHARGGFTDAKSDIYSLGIVMYEMLTGRVPFDADTAVSVALKHMQEKPVEPMKLNPSIPFAVNRIIMKAIQKEVGLRYQSATEMIKDLTLALKNPEGDFVEEDLAEDGATQIISTLHLEEEAEKPEAMNKKGKKKGKMARFFDEHPKAKVPVIILSFILIFLLTLVITYSIVTIVSKANTVKDVYIPNLVGMTNEQARQTAEDKKIVYEVSGEEFSSEYEAGMVISQEPKFIENYRIKEKSTIKVVISKGTEKTTVPSALGGKTFEEVEEKLREANLKAEKVEEKSTKIEEGKVIRVEPDEKTEINAGETVKVIVSIGTGIPKVMVDSVVGKAEADAKRILTEKKLEVNVEYAEDNTKENGVVLKQSVDSGTEVEEGTKITITINKIAKLVDGTVNINLKSLTGYTAPKPNNNSVNGTNTTGSTAAEPQVTLKVVVKSGDGSEDTVENKKNSQDKENISLKISGVGNVQVSVYVDGNLKDRKQQNIEKQPIFNFN